MYFRERHLALTGVLLALLLALSGCGGGGGSTESTSASTSGETAAAGESEAGGGEEAGEGEAEEGESGNESFLGGGAVSAAAEKEKFVEDVNNICFRHSQEQAKQVEAYDKKHGITAGEPNQKQQEKIIVAIILPIVHETIAELEEYEPIPSQEAKLNVFIKVLTEATEVTEKHPNFLAEEGEKEPYNEARARAGDMGTYLCGQA
jgi:hypothetical protein